MAGGIRELKRVLASMRSRIDQSLTAAEKRKLLKDIATGLIADADELRSYVGRLEQTKKKREKEATATLNGKVVDAQERKALGGVDVTIQQTTFKEKTDGSGNFIFDKLIKGRTIRINAVLSGYKPVISEYQATMDNTQNVIVKMVRIETGAAGRGRKEDKPGGH